MYTLNAEIREKGVKGRQLRRKGLIPAVLFAKHLDESVSIQIPQRDAEHFLQTNSVGYSLELMIDGEKHMALLKDITYVPGANKLEHLSFQAMKKGESIASVAHIVLLNKELVQGIVQQSLNELSYRALPSDLTEKIEIDLTGKTVGYTLTVAELDISKNEAIEILSPSDSLVVSITALKAVEEAASEAEDADVQEEDQEKPSAENE